MKGNLDYKGWMKGNLDDQVWIEGSLDDQVPVTHLKHYTNSDGITEAIQANI